MRLTCILIACFLLAPSLAAQTTGPAPVQNQALHYTLTPPDYFKAMPQEELDKLNADIQKAAQGQDPAAITHYAQGFRTSVSGSIPYILIQDSPRSVDSKKDLLDGF